jgi:outer membrane receptor for ferrienterochelin and colicin
LSLLVILLISPGSTWAGTTGKIAGIVSDGSTGDPLVGANVFLEGTAMGASTDEDGFYFIINIPPGKYSVTVSYVGYEKITTSNVSVMVDRTTDLEFPLNPAPIEADAIMVVAVRPVIDKDVTGSQQFMDSDQINRAPVNDVSDVLRQQSGIISTGETSFIRGGIPSELNYLLDGTSLNSGLISDNYQRLNLTAVEEISVLTGGYSAEYGQAMSGVVNVVTKEASHLSRGVSGVLKYRMRPAGQYHWGENMYDQSLLKYTYWNDLNNWQTSLDDLGPEYYAAYFNRFYGPGTVTNNPDWDGTNVPTAEQLRSTYMQQLTPDEILADYTERVEHEIEGSVYGSFLDNFSFLLSGRYKRGVNIFPQSEPYNPEYNIQAKINYILGSDQKLGLNLVHGWYKSSAYTESNWNNMETSQEARWQPNGEVRHPYGDMAYAPWGGAWIKGPQEKTFDMAALSWHHTLSPATFYTVQFSYLSDYTEELQDYSNLTTSLSTVGWGDSWWDLSGNYRLEGRQTRIGNYSDSKVFTLDGNLTSQVHKSHLVKTGLEFKLYDLDYQHYYMEFPLGDIWHLDNVFNGKPLEIAGYIEDKMEYQGITLNIGLRFDAFNSQKDYAESIYDPLAFQVWNGGDGYSPSNTADIWQANQAPPSWYVSEPGIITDYRGFFDGVRNDKNTVSSDWKVAIAPRIGVSFPITENSKLRFNYGHFYQRPSWSKLIGFPTSWYESDPVGTVRMDQWQGWYGQPGLDYERTIQYELGFTQSLFDILRLDFVGYYKDASNLTRFSHSGTYNKTGGFTDSGDWNTLSDETFSTSRNVANDGHDNIFYTNNAYRDVRGIEISIDKLFTSQWSANLTFNYSMTTGGASGYWQYREDETTIHQPWSFDEVKLDWISSYILKANVNYVTPHGIGWIGLLGDITASLYYEYFAGPEYTYYPEGYTGLLVPNNKRWFPHQRTDLKIFKRIPLGSVTPILGIEVYNLFNNFDRNLLWWDDLEQWEENGRMPQAKEYGGETEDDVWFFYNSVSNPMRMVFLTLGFEF